MSLKLSMYLRVSVSMCIHRVESGCIMYVVDVCIRLEASKESREVKSMTVKPRTDRTEWWFVDEVEFNPLGKAEEAYDVRGSELLTGKEIRHVLVACPGVLGLFLLNRNGAGAYRSHRR